MNRRPFMKLVSALAIASALAATAASAENIRIGAVAPKTGPLAGRDRHAVAINLSLG